MWRFNLIRDAEKRERRERARTRERERERLGGERARERERERERARRGGVKWSDSTGGDIREINKSVAV